jgi:hypothetical protein
MVALPAPTYAFGVIEREQYGPPPPPPPPPPGGFTCMVAEQVASPLGPLKVPVYVIVFSGETEREPESTGVVVPISLFKTSVVA